MSGKGKKRGLVADLRVVRVVENVPEVSAIHERLNDYPSSFFFSNSVTKHKMALLFAGLLFSKKSPLLRMLYEANKDEETFELVPAEEGDTDTVSLYGHLYKKQKIVKEELPFIKPPLKEQ